MKPQSVRLYDVFFIGPFLLYAANKKNLSKVDRATLIGIGIGTILYNGYNYIKKKQNENQKTA